MSPFEKDHRGKRHLSARGRSWLLIGVLTIAGVTGIKGCADNQRQDKQDNDQAQALRASAIESCEVGNRARLIRIRDYRRDIAQLQAQVQNLEANVSVIEVVPPSLLSSDALQAITETNEVTILESETSIRYKRQTIQDEIASVAQFAISPGSPIADCVARVRGR